MKSKEMLIFVSNRVIQVRGGERRREGGGIRDDERQNELSFVVSTKLKLIFIDIHVRI